MLGRASDGFGQHMPHSSSLLEVPLDGRNRDAECLGDDGLALSGVNGVQHSVPQI